MLRFIARRLIQAVPTLFGITLVVFFVTRLAPGDPVNFADPRITGEDIARVRAARGLDQPLPIQYLRWLSGAIRGDLGTSFQSREPVLSIILSRLPNTLELTGAALVVGLLVGVPVGVAAAVRRGSWIDSAWRVGAVIGDAVPVFWLGLLLIMVFGVHLRWFPIGSAYTIGQDPNDLGDRLWHLILPAATLAMGFIALYSRYLRTELLEVIGQDYIRTARAKGLPEPTVIWRHAVRNALLPLITALGGALPTLFTGAAITEIVFTWPGMGRLALESVLARDYPILMGLTLFAAVLIILGQLLSDVLYAVVDPRVRLD